MLDPKQTSSESYIELSVESCIQKLDEDFKKENRDRIIKQTLKALNNENGRVFKFMKFYEEIISDNVNYFKGRKDSFRQFTKEYSIQGLTLGYLNFLETKKIEILDLLKKKELLELYKKYFYKQEIKNKKGIHQKSFGSFYSKLVHTFHPEEYTALDNSIKKSFGLNREGFFISFLAVSRAYRQFVVNNNSVIEGIKNEIQSSPKSDFLNFKLISDLKLIDLILWVKENRY